MFNHTYRLNLGDKVMSNITGFIGLVTSAATHLNGCDRYWVQPPVDKEGKQREGSWFDDGELVVLEDGVVEAKNQDRGGFPDRVK